MIEAAQLNRNAVEERSLYAKITRRIVPYLFLLYIVAYIDRVNVGFAAIDMKRQLGFSDSVYGTGAAIFFLGYAFFDLPSSMMIPRVGTRLWIARIMISWGFIAALMALVRTPTSFYLTRFLLGVGEAGFVPGMLLYLTQWFPSHVRARAVAKFMTATSLAGVFGGPLSSALLKLDGLYGLSGWQWLFIAEGIPTILLGISVLFILRDSPTEAHWLMAEEQQWLMQELEADRARYGATQHHSFADAFRLPILWLLIVVYITVQIGVYVVNLWMPLMLSNLHGSPDASGIARLSTVTYLLAAIVTVIVGWSSDRWNERSAHIAGCMVCAGVGFALAGAATTMPLALCGFSLTTIGMFSSMGPFWALMTRNATGSAAAAGVALVTSLGALGGFTGPYITGLLRESTHSFARGLYAIAVLFLMAAIISLMTKRFGSSTAQLSQT
ncbi:MAG: MFS transporter [Edaphobacter sp.]|uniref:MFS transporter n=1 Tax=Edaphobacter sp. TaxID=1934404 RepID=UPI0023947393|nr:MFS transporter [Edaphobacter sp.]MDE1175965.1 MFS transporter [Edaphobacter sp.]